MFAELACFLVVMYGTITCLAGKDAADAADYMSTKLIYFCGSQSDQPCISVISRRFVLSCWCM